MVNLYKSGYLQQISETWHKEFELKQIGDEDANGEHTAKTIRDFMTEHQATFKEIESFMHILNDWVEETKSNLAAQDK